MKIKYAKGGVKEIEADVDLVTENLTAEFGPDFVHYNGLIWESDAESTNDDGANAVAELLDDEGDRMTDFLSEGCQ